MFTGDKDGWHNQNYKKLDMESRIAHNIKHRQHANDEFMTPKELARTLVPKVPIELGSTILDPCPGEGAFINAYPSGGYNFGLAPHENFLEFDWQVDYIITNPPYSDLDRWLEHSFKIARIGVCLLLGLHNITPKRLELANEAGFGLYGLHLCKVFHWFGISAFCIWLKDQPDIVTYDRVVWR